MNIVFITMDGARVDRMFNAPNYSNLISKSAFFSKVIAYAPFTIAAMHAVFSGTYGFKNGVNSYWKTPNFKKTIYKTLPKFLKSETPKFREGKLKISIIYVDCNDYKTAIESLECCMPYLSNGGVIAIDECRLGGETKALTEICSKYNLELFTSTFGGFVSLYTVKNT